MMAKLNAKRKERVSLEYTKEWDDSMSLLK